MSINKRWPIPIRALINFISFAPGKIIFLHLSSIVYAISGVFGMLLSIPLAQLAGVDFQTEATDQSPWGFLSHIAKWVNDIGFTANLGPLLTAYVTLFLVMSAFTYYRTMLAIRFQQDFTKAMRFKIYKALLASKWEYLSSARSSEYLHRVGGQVQSMSTSAHQVIGLFHKILTMIIYTGVMLMVNWQFTLLSFTYGLILAIIVFPLRWSIRDAGEKQLAGHQNILRILSEQLNSLKMIKSSGHEWGFQQRLKSASEELEEQQIRLTRAGSVISFVSGFGMTLGFCFILYYAVTWLDVAVANFFLLLIIMSRIMPQVAGLQAAVQGIIFTLPSYRDIETTLEEATKMQETTIDPSKERLGLKHNIRLDKVNFTYAESERPIIKELDFVIPVKKTIALIGPSGIGKTTLADLIVGLLHPVSGKITIDGNELNSDTISKWRRSIAYVTQETYLFHDSIRNNLTWVNPEVSDDEIWHAIKTAALEECIKGLPEELDSVIGDRGVRLSGGEQQRLAIARALLAKPDLLVLDEATSSLDKVNEKLIHQALINLHGTLTVVIIAHRETTIRHADIILNLAATPAKVLTPDQFENSITIG